MNRDIIILSAFFIISGILLIIFDTTMTSVRDVMLGVDVVNTNANAVRSLNAQLNNLRLMDFGISFLYFTGLLISLVLASRLPSDLIYYGMSLLGLLILALIIPPFSNLYLTAATNPALIASANHYPITLFIAQNLPTITIVFFFLSLIVIYRNNSGNNFNSTGGSGLI